MLTRTQYIVNVSSVVMKIEVNYVYVKGEEREREREH